jgi:hypothetical protein
LESFYRFASDACGELQVSNIGFNSKKDTAIIEVYFMSGGMSCYANYLIFSNTQKGEWDVIDVLQTIIY